MYDLFYSVLFLFSESKAQLISLQKVGVLSLLLIHWPGWLNVICSFFTANLIEIFMFKVMIKYFGQNCAVYNVVLIFVLRVNFVFL